MTVLVLRAYAKTAPTGSPLGTFTKARRKNVTREYNAPGGGGFVINRNDAEAAWASPGNYILAYRDNTSGSPVAGFILDSGADRMVDPDEQGGEDWTRDGEGPEAILREAIVWHRAFLNDPNGHWQPGRGRVHYDDAQPAKVLIRQLREAKERGCFPFLTWDFTATRDSDGNPWSNEAARTFNIPIKLDLLSLVGELREADMVVEVTPAFVVRMWEHPHGSDLSGSIVFTKGVDLIDTSDRQVMARHARSATLVEGTDGDGDRVYRAASSGSMETLLGRRKEGAFDYPRTATGSILTRVAERQNRRSRKLHDGPLTLPVLDKTDQVALVDYLPGDTVTIDIPGEYDETTDEPHGITLRDRDEGAGEYDVALEFADLGYDPVTGTDFGGGRKGAIGGDGPDPGGDGPGDGPEGGGGAEPFDGNDYLLTHFEDPPAFVSVGTAEFTDEDDDLNAPLDFSAIAVEEGDTILVAIQTDGFDLAEMPEGYSQLLNTLRTGGVDDDMRVIWLTKTADGSESSIDFEWESPPVTGVAWVGVYRGPAAPVIFGGVEGNPSSASWSTSTAYLLAFCFAREGTSSIGDFDFGSLFNFNWNHGFRLAEYLDPTAGPHDPVAFSLSGTTEAVSGTIVLAIPTVGRLLFSSENGGSWWEGGNDVAATNWPDVDVVVADSVYRVTSHGPNVPGDPHNATLSILPPPDLPVHMGRDFVVTYRLRMLTQQTSTEVDASRRIQVQVYDDEILEQVEVWFGGTVNGPVPGPAITAGFESAVIAALVDDDWYLWEWGVIDERIVARIYPELDTPPGWQVTAVLGSTSPDTYFLQNVALGGDGGDESMEIDLIRVRAVGTGGDRVTRVIDHGTGGALDFGEPFVAGSLRIEVDGTPVTPTTQSASGGTAQLAAAVYHDPDNHPAGCGRVTVTYVKA